MRRLRTARSPDPDDFAEEGFDRIELEGEAIGPVGDEIPWLRAFGLDMEGQILPAAGSSLEPDAQRILRQARELVGFGRRLDALLLLRRWQEDHPRDAETRVLLAELLDQGGEPDQALEELGRAVADATDPVPVLVMRGAILARSGRAIEAERELREAIGRRAGFGPAHLHLGIALLRRGMGADAVAALEEALRCVPDDPESTYYLGEAFQLMGQLPQALAALERAAQLMPSEPRSYLLMGRVLDRMGRTDDARLMHQRARGAAGPG
jgi:Flp pilus assembly protein TadD